MSEILHVFEEQFEYMYMFIYIYIYIIVISGYWYDFCCSFVYS